MYDKNELKDFLQAFDDACAWPFKRVQASPELIEKYNEDKVLKLVQFAITVSKETEVTDEMLWKEMNSKKTYKEHTFGDGSWISNPPHTGMKKKTLLE